MGSIIRESEFDLFWYFGYMCVCFCAGDDNHQRFVGVDIVTFPMALSASTETRTRARADLVGVSSLTRARVDELDVVLRGGFLQTLVLGSLCYFFCLV